MNKMKKRISVLAMTMMMSMASVLPAQAVAMASFPQQSRGSYTGNHTRALQVMLINHNSTTRNSVLNAGGADGSYGSGTELGVAQFQAMNGLTSDGVCGTNTWTKFRNTLQQTNVGDKYRFYKGYSPYQAKNGNCMRLHRTSDIWNTYTNDMWYNVG